MVRVDRSYPAPASLAEEKAKASGSYRKDDVIDTLVRDSGGKCYICGIHPTDHVVEHLVAHKGNRDLMFDWDNLFLACHLCNSVKNQRKYDTGIIDCCKVDPEDVMHFCLIEGDVEISATDSSASLTAGLIHEVFNLRNSGIRKADSAERLDSLRAEMNCFLKDLEELSKEPSSFILGRIRHSLDRKSPFAAFKRCYIRDNSSSYPELLKFLS